MIRDKNYVKQAKKKASQIKTRKIVLDCFEKNMYKRRWEKNKMIERHSNMRQILKLYRRESEHLWRRKRYGRREQEREIQFFLLKYKKNWTWIDRVIEIVYKMHVCLKKYMSGERLKWLNNSWWITRSNDVER